MITFYSYNSLTVKINPVNKNTPKIIPKIYNQFTKICVPKKPPKSRFIQSSMKYLLTTENCLITRLLTHSIFVNYYM